MARKPNPQAAATDLVFNEEALSQGTQDLNQLSLITQQTDARVRAVALQLNYELPADCTDPDLIQRDISANMRRSVEAVLQVGCGLLVLKEACDHGSFMKRLDVLGIDGSLARRFMQSALKFSNRATSHILPVAGTQSKLFELLVLDDEQIEELELIGQTGNLKLDDVDAMGVRELREAVRKERKEKQLTKSALDEACKENADTKVKLAQASGVKVAATDWPEQFKVLMDQTAAIGRDFKKQFDALEAVRQAAMNDIPEDPDPALRRALATLAADIVDIMARIVQRGDTFDAIFSKTLCAFHDGEGRFK